jgi:hypothetical protein
MAVCRTATRKRVRLIRDCRGWGWMARVGPTMTQMSPEAVKGYGEPKMDGVIKALVFVHGPNGVGKSTVCKAIYRRLSNSAWLESEWCRMTQPFVLSEETTAMVTDNISHLLRSYLTCSWLEYVVFSYGFHGPRQRIWESVLSGLDDIPYTYAPITLTCDEEENTRRMVSNGRDTARIQRALDNRHLYEALPYPIVDTTQLTIDQAADRVVEVARSAVRNIASTAITGAEKTEE